jgi:hypothetical protein
VFKSLPLHNYAFYGKDKKRLFSFGFLMIGGNFPNISFQTFYVSKEETNSPLLIEIIKIGKKLKESGFLTEEISATISIGYGKRILINSEVEDFSKIKKEEIIEIVDYDPIKNNLLLIGPVEPRLETPVHWMIHHAREEINAVVEIHDSGFAEKLNKKIPVIDDKYPISSIEHIKEVLRGLRDSKNIVIKNQSVLFIGANLTKIEELIFKTYEDLK